MYSIIPLLSICLAYHPMPPPSPTLPTLPSIPPSTTTPFYHFASFLPKNSFKMPTCLSNASNHTPFVLSTFP